MGEEPRDELDKVLAEMYPDLDQEDLDFEYADGGMNYKDLKETRKSRKLWVILLVALIVVCLVGAGIYWFGFRQTAMPVANKGEHVVTGMENQPKIVPIAGAKEAVFSKELNGEIIYINDKQIWLWDINTQKERWRISNPLPMPEKDSGKESNFYLEYGGDGKILISYKIKEKGDTLRNVRPYILMLDHTDGKIIAKDNSYTAVRFAGNGQVVACTANLDLLVFQGKGQMDKPSWQKEKMCQVDGIGSMGFGLDTVRIYKQDKNGALYDGWGTVPKKIYREYKLSDGSEAEKGYSHISGYNAPEGGVITDYKESVKLKATRIGYKDVQGRQNNVFVDKDGRVIYQAQPGYLFNRFSEDYKFITANNPDAAIISIVDTTNWAEITKISAPEGYNQLFDICINDKYVWIDAVRSKSGKDQKNKVSKLMVYDIKTGKPATELLAEINNKETNGYAIAFLTTEGFIVYRDTQVTHLSEDGQKLWNLELPKGSYVAKYYSNKKGASPVLAITNSKGVIDSYLK